MRCGRRVERGEPFYEGKGKGSSPKARSTYVSTCQHQLSTYSTYADSKSIILLLLYPQRKIRQQQRRLTSYSVLIYSSTPNTDHRPINPSHHLLSTRTPPLYIDPSYYVCLVTSYLSSVPDIKSNRKYTCLFPSSNLNPRIFRTLTLFLLSSLYSSLFSSFPSRSPHKHQDDPSCPVQSSVTRLIRNPPILLIIAPFTTFPEKDRQEAKAFWGREETKRHKEMERAREVKWEKRKGKPHNDRSADLGSGSWKEMIHFQYI